ncbi:uncharacterized protein LOC100115682 isoform X6 [Nasonia vitripennis]|uniref:Uncharacterized protein n=1 Tax=Nasonia vitripennis TaxID=7425 RepID=A0A7M7QF37_NASVI|nr:uncharacterized protein LOC100115682 isoform X6 [Nasonia vitripennis]
MSKMHETESFWNFKYDNAIISYLNLICERYDVRDQDKLIATHGRTLGTFLTTMKNLNPAITDLQSCMDSPHWANTVAAIRSMAGFDEKERTFASPSTAQLIGLLLKNVMKVLKSIFNVTKDKVGYRKLASFNVELEAYWLPIIGSKIVPSQNSKRKKDEGKTIEEVTPHDKNIMMEFLSRRRDILFDKALKNLDSVVYTELASAQMIYVQCWNGRRPGENSRTHLEDYTNRTITNQDSCHFKSLTREEKMRAVRFSIMNLAGKKNEGLDGRVYLDKKDEKIIDFLVHNRSKVGICTKNKHLFVGANMNENDHLDGHLVMKKLVELCHKNYKKFENLFNVTATGFRKFIATQYKRQTNRRHSDALIRHLSHTKKTHDKYYRQVLPQEAVQVTTLLEEIISKNTESYESQDVTDQEFVEFNFQKENTSTKKGKIDDKATQLHAIASLKVLLDATKSRDGTAACASAVHAHTETNSLSVKLHEAVQSSGSTTVETTIGVQSLLNGKITAKQTTSVESEDEEEIQEALNMAWPNSSKKKITYLLVAPILFPLWLTLPDTRTTRAFMDKQSLGRIRRRR